MAPYARKRSSSVTICYRTVLFNYILAINNLQLDYPKLYPVCGDASRTRITYLLRPQWRPRRFLAAMLINSYGQLNGSRPLPSRFFKDFPRICPLLLRWSRGGNNMRQRKKFATVELKDIRHLIVQNEDSQPDGFAENDSASGIRSAENGDSRSAVAPDRSSPQASSKKR